MGLLTAFASILSPLGTSTTQVARSRVCPHPRLATCMYALYVSPRRITLGDQSKPHESSSPDPTKTAALLLLQAHLLNPGSTSLNNVVPRPDRPGGLSYCSCSTRRTSPALAVCNVAVTITPSCSVV